MFAELLVDAPKRSGAPTAVRSTTAHTACPTSRRRLNLRRRQLPCDADCWSERAARHLV